MNRRKVSWLTCFCGLVLLLNNCAAPRVLWPQKDIPSAEWIERPGAPIVLMASRDSEFKRALVDEIGNALASKGINQRTIGIEGLKEVDPSEYDVVVVISSCIAWGLERKVQVFLKEQEMHSHIILVTTSGEGDWMPESLNRDVDAISSASTLTTVGAAARNVVARISARLP